MRLSHTLLLVSMLSFGGFMVSKLVHAMVTPSGEIREVSGQGTRPVIEARPAIDRPSEDRAMTEDSERTTVEPIQSCPLPQDSRGRNASAQSSGERGTKKKAMKGISPTCCCDVRRKKLHLI